MPQVHSSHLQEKLSAIRLYEVLPIELFIIRSEDGGDYGADKILEIIHNGNATNIRSQVQLKSINKCSKSGVLKFRIERKTLNYLSNTQNAIFIIYSSIENMFFWDWVDVIEAKRIADMHTGVDNRKSVTHPFAMKLDSEAAITLHQQIIKRNEQFKNFTIAFSPFDRAIITDELQNPSYKKLFDLFAESKYEKVIALAADYKEKTQETLSLMALSYYRMHNYLDALKLAIEAEKICESVDVKKIKAIILCEMGMSQRIDGPLKEAWKLYSQLPRESWTWMDYYNLGNMESGLKQYSDAEKNYKIALELNSKAAEVWKNLSDLYRQQNRRDDELRCLDAALSIDENLIEALVSKAITISQLNSNYRDAIDLLERAIKLPETDHSINVSIHYWLSSCYSKIHQYDNALFYIANGLKHYPGDYYLENLRLEVLSSAAQADPVHSDSAISDLRSHIEANPKNIKLKLELIKILALTSVGAPPDRNLISDCFMAIGIELDQELHETLEYIDVINFFNYLSSIQECRKNLSFKSLMFETFDICLSDEARISLRVDLLFSTFLADASKCRNEKQYLDIFESHSEKFLALNDYCARVLVSDLIGEKNIERVAERITFLLLNIPEVLLKELSRQIGWAIHCEGLPLKLADIHLKNSHFTGNWFGLSLDPVLHGCNAVLKILPEN